MSIRAGLFNYIKDNVPLVNNRVYPSVLPNTFQTPALVYRIITDLAGYDHDGPVELHNPRVQIDIWGKTPKECEQVAQELEAALLGYIGPMGDIEYTAGWRIDTITDFYEADTRLHRISTDYRGWYQPLAQEVS